METVAQNVWTKSKLLIKGGIIGFIILLLQIPTHYVKGLIEERENWQKQAATEVNSKWAGRQNILGPILVVPFWQPVGYATSAQKSKKPCLLSS